MEPTLLDSLRGTYSDLHKDVYGHRPRLVDTVFWNSIEMLQEEIAELDKELEKVMAREAEQQKEAIAEFETKIGDLIYCGAVDRETAIRWLHEAYSTDGDSDFLCWHLGLPYGYLDKKEN